MNKRTFISLQLLALLSSFSVCFTSVSVLAQSGNPAGSRSEGSDDKIRIGILISNTKTGHLHRQGIEEALNNHSFGKNVYPIAYAYSNESQGLDRLLQMIHDSLVDIIIGPTESGVFVRAYDRQEELAKYKVPVISGLVTAKVGNHRDDWFFRINVDVTRRVQTIYDFINKYWVHSVAVIYADTEFGRRAEAAFESELSSTQRYRYLSLTYENPPNPRPQLREILRHRPEAVGFFGEREDIEQIYRELRAMNEREMPYNPLFFTILDARQTAKWVDNIYFVSVTEGESGSLASSSNALEEYDDVRALGYDVGLLILNELERLGVRELDAQKRQQFRDQFAGLLSRSGRQAGTKTDITFANCENSTTRRVFHLVDKQAIEVNLARTVGWSEKVSRKLRLIFDSYGWWPIVSTIVIMAVALFISWTDLRRWFKGSNISLFKSKFLYMFTFGHFGLVMLLYLLLAETGRIRYDSIITVVIISLAPSALLRTTLFETPQGRAVGLEGFYKKLLSWVDEQLMKSRHKAYQARVNLIAYNNSQDAMRQALFDIYRNHPVPAQSGRLIQELEEDLRGEPNYFDRRRILARRLLKLYDLERLKAEGLVPPGWDDQHPVDPQRIVRMAAKYCARESKKGIKINKKIKEEMARLRRTNKKRHDELQDFLKAELKDAIAIEGELNVKIRFLFVLLGFDIQWFIDKKLLKKQEVAKERKRLELENRSRKRDWRFWRRKWWRAAIKSK